MQLVDATAYTGGYPDAHAFLAVAALGFYVLAWLGVGSLLDDLIPRSRLAALAAMALALIGAAMTARSIRGSADIHLIRADLGRPGFPIARKLGGTLEALLLDRLAPLEELEGEDAGSLLARAFADPPSSELLDTRLPKGRQRWNVVLIAADTLRFDETGFSAPGASPGSTPNIDRFAADAIRFPRAYTPYPTSNFAYSSLLTGLYPRLSPAYQARNRSADAPKGTSIAETLRDRDYQTWAVTAFNRAGVENPATFGHTRSGFDLFNPRRNIEELRADEVTASALEVLAAREIDRPFMMWVHYMDPHAPYEPHEGFETGQEPRELYRGEISFMDRHMQPLLDRLAQDDLRDNTIVCVFSDHGESFDEHNTVRHNSNLHEEQIHIPLAMRIPGVEARSLPVTINLVDIAPSILGLLGVDDGMRRNGRDLSGVLAGIQRPEDWLSFSYSERYPRDPILGREMQRCLVFDELKLIRYAGDPSIEIYDLRSDPEESLNVLDMNDRRHRRLKGFIDALDERIDRFFGEPAVGRQEEARRRMDELLAWLEDDNPGNDLLALVEFSVLLFGYDEEYSSRVAQSVGPSRLARARRRLIALTENSRANVSLRTIAMKLLSHLPDPELAPFMKRVMTAPFEAARRAAALWLARQGDDSGRDILATSLGGADHAWSMTAAVGLARLGERRAIPWLSTALDRHRRGPVLAGLRGLASLQFVHFELMAREKLSAFSTGLDLPRCQLELARLAAGRRGPETTLLMLRLSRSAEPDVQALARRELDRRLTRSKRRDASRMMEQQVLGDLALRNRNFESARAHFEAARGLLGRLDLDDDLLTIRLSRVLLATSRIGQAREMLSPLAKTRQQVRPYLRRYARSLDAAAEAGVSFPLPPEDAALEAAISLEHPPPRTPSTFFARGVKLVNRGELPIPGGEWPHGLRLVWLFRHTGTGDYHDPGADTPLLQSFLPPAGLRPDQEIELTVIGMTPPAAGRWQPVLALAFRPWLSEDHRELLSLAPIEVGRNE